MELGHADLFNHGEPIRPSRFGRFGRRAIRDPRRSPWEGRPTVHRAPGKERGSSERSSSRAVQDSRILRW